MLFDEATHRIIGCGIVGPNAGDLIAEAALAIEMGADASDIGLTIHPHPTLSETVAMAAEMYEGTITDLIAPEEEALRIVNQESADHRRFDPMAIKQDFQQQLENQIAVWQGQIKDYQERLGQVSAQAKADYEKSIATLRENADQAGKLLGQVRDANEGAWRDMQGASAKALAQLQQGWAEALKRFQ